MGMHPWITDQLLADGAGGFGLSSRRQRGQGQNQPVIAHHDKQFVFLGDRLQINPGKRPVTPPPNQIGRRPDRVGPHSHPDFAAVCDILERWASKGSLCNWVLPAWHARHTLAA
jgi:hypothetical protein